MFSLKLFNFCPLMTVPEREVSAICDRISKLLNESNKHKQELCSLLSKFKTNLEQMSEQLKQTRRHLLNEPKVVERRNKILENVVDLTQINFKFGSQFAKSNTLPEFCSKIIANSEECSPKFTFVERPSILNYSFQLADISTCEYIAPNSNTSIGNLSPIKDKL